MGVTRPPVNGDPVLVAIVEELRAATDSSRVTVRGPVAGSGSGTTIALLAEDLAPGVASMVDGPQAGIAEAETYTYLRETHEVLIQPDCAVGPRPPESLTGLFGVRAQMLGPLVVGGELVGTVSVHDQRGTRDWSDADAAALARAVARVLEHWASRGSL